MLRKLSPKRLGKFGVGVDLHEKKQKKKKKTLLCSVTQKTCAWEHCPHNMYLTRLSSLPSHEHLAWLQGGCDTFMTRRRMPLFPEATWAAFYFVVTCQETGWFGYFAQGKRDDDKVACSLTGNASGRQRTPTLSDHGQQCVFWTSVLCRLAFHSRKCRLSFLSTFGKKQGQI